MLGQVVLLQRSRLFVSITPWAGKPLSKKVALFYPKSRGLVVLSTGPYFCVSDVDRIVRGCISSYSGIFVSYKDYILPAYLGSL